MVKFKIVSVTYVKHLFKSLPSSSTLKFVYLTIDGADVAKFGFKEPPGGTFISY